MALYCVLILAALLSLVSADFQSFDAEGESPALWGTYRPHALMSVRARVPHSPYFGFMYHGVKSDNIRHLASDHESSLRSYGYSRHDGRTFAEHVVEDKELNVAVTYTFARHPQSNDAWSMRISGSPLDASRSTDLVSIVFYAVAGPEELEKKDGRASRSPWGTVRLADSTIVDSSGVSGDCHLHGDADNMGGGYRLVAKEPRQGSLSIPGSVYSTMGSSAARKRRRSKFASISSSPELSRFHVAAPKIDPEKAFLVDNTLSAFLRVSRQRKASEERDELDADDSSEDEENDETGFADAHLRSKRHDVTTLSNEVDAGAPLVLVQRIVHVPFEMEVAFSGPDALRKELNEDAALGQALDDLLAERRKAFDERFENVFGLRSIGFGNADVTFARMAVANMLGGVGYFYGRTLVESKDKKKIHRAPAGLLTATPSRALFPRGFLWDEGFHQLIIQRWDPDLSRACLTSWLSQMDDSGWIPREQAVGLEARHRFPAHVKELMIQSPNIANPPTILMPLRVFAVLRPANDSQQDGSCSEDASDTNGETCSVSKKPSEAETTNDKFIDNALDNAVKSFEWLSRSQAGEDAMTFRWRGRSSSLASPQGYPLTLASGLDDYPRGYDVSIHERHLDLHCWVTWAAGALRKMFDAAGRDSQPFESLQLSLLAHLEAAHGRKERSGNADQDLLLCDFDGRNHVCELGYVTILPLVLGLLEPSNPRVGAILELLELREHLRSVAGIRSLSKQSPHYRKGNDYWTGPIWMPFNYLVLASLRTKYGREEGPYRKRAERLYTELKREILGNARREFELSGYLWENYSPSDGKGKSGRQFTGWSALVVLIYADMYDGVL